MALVFVIESNPTDREGLRRLLSADGDSVVMATNYIEAAEEAIAAQPDLVLTDLDLPGVDGLRVVGELRKHSEVPLMVVSSRTSNYDELMSISTGADDFVRKPYDERILLARIQSLLRRCRPNNMVRYMTHRGVRLDLSSGQVACGTQKADLTKNELRILGLLMSRAGNVVTREEIVTTMWDSNAYVDDNTLTVNVNRLRRVLDSIGAKGYILTHRGLGYSV